jgi:3-oxoadipate enol-lactonase
MKYQLEKGFLEYEVSGKGIPILFIHGYPLSKKIWDGQREALSKIATVITVDLRGHGASYPFEAPYSMDMLAEDCNRLLNGIGIKLPAIVCGLSMGGYITFALYRRHPQLFKAMILTSTRAAPDSADGKTSREAGVKNVMEHGVSYIADGMLLKLVSPITEKSNPELVSSIREILLGTSVNGVIGALQGMRDRADSTPLLPQIKCPTLIIQGADDQIIPVAEAETMDLKISDSRLVVIPQAGHLVNMEQPELYNRAVSDFIGALPQD